MASIPSMAAQAEALYHQYVESFGYSPKNASQLLKFCKRQGLSIKYSEAAQAMKNIKKQKGNEIVSKVPTPTIPSESAKSKVVSTSSKGQVLHTTVKQPQEQSGEDEYSAPSKATIKDKADVGTRSTESKTSSNGPNDDKEGKLKESPLKPDQHENSKMHSMPKTVITSPADNQSTACHGMIPRDLKWYHVVNAVKHEMFPLMSTSMQSAIETLQIDPEDLSQETTDRVIAALHDKRSLSTMEVAEIKKVVQRTKEYKERGERASYVLK